MLSLQSQGGADIVLVGTAIVNAGIAGAMAVVVIKHGLDDVRQHAEIGHPTAREFRLMTQSEHRPEKIIPSRVDTRKSLGLCCTH